MFEKSLYQRYSIIYALDQSVSGGMKTDPNTIQFTFRDNLPTDDITQIQALVAAGATLPQEYLYRFAPGITDPQEVTDMIAKQRADSEYSDDLTGDQKPVEQLSESGNDDQQVTNVGQQDSKTVQQVSLNGSQITSMIQIVQNVASGTLPRDSAVEMLTAAFPFDEAKADSILSDAGNGFTIDGGDDGGENTKGTDQGVRGQAGQEAPTDSK